MPAKRSKRSKVSKHQDDDFESESEQKSPTMEESVSKLAKLLRDGLASSFESRWRPQQQKRPPKFSGRIHEDPEHFIEKFEAHLEDIGLAEEDFLEHLKDNLTGDARKWFEPFTNLNMYWLTFKRRFLEHFDGPDARARLNINLLTDRQEAQEPGRDFVARKMALARRCPVESFAHLIQTTISLMRPDYRFALAQREIMTFDNLLDFVTVLDNAKPDTRPQSAPRRAAPPPSSPAIPSTSRLPPDPPPCRYCPGKHWHRDCPVIQSRYQAQQQTQQRTPLKTSDTIKDPKPSTSTATAPKNM